MGIASRSRCAEILRAKRDEIVAACGAASLEPRALRDTLERLARLLERGTSTPPAFHEQPSSTPDLDALFEDHAALRRSVLEHLERAGVRPDVEETALLCAGLDASLAAGIARSLDAGRGLVDELRRAQASLARSAAHARLRAAVASAMSAPGSVRVMLQSCTEAIVRHLGAAFARAWLKDERAEVLVLEASAGQYEHLDGGHARVPIGSLKIGRIAATRTPHLTNAVLDDPWISDREWARREGMVAFAGYPLVAGEQLLGVLALFARAPLDADTLEALGSIAALVAEGVVRRRAQAEVDRAARDQRFLADASAALASSLDVRATLATIAELAVPDLADWCAVDVATELGRFERLAIVRRGSGKLRQIEEVDGPYRRAFEWSSALDEVLRTRRPVLESVVTDETLRRYATGPDDLEALRSFRVTSFLIVPLLARGHALGAITLLATGGRRHYSESDVALARDLGARAGLALANALLYQEAQRAILARQQVLAIVSHDLRNPLGAISLGVQQLLRPGGVEPARVRRAAEGIRRAGDRALRLIHDLLDAAAVEAEHLNVRCVPVELEPLVRDAALAMAPLADERSVRIVVESTLPPGERALADEERVHQVLGNLLGNALKVVPPAGRIVVSVGRAADGESLEVRVRDTGPGVAPEVRAHLFDRFFQGEEGDRSGVGLGLFIARGIVAAHGGRIGVESEPGEGATFWFTLPRAGA